MRIWRALVKAVTADDGPLQRLLLAGFAGETRGEGVERYQPYGLATKPLADTEALVISIDASQALVVAVDCSAHRPQDLESGDVCLWHHSGTRVTLKADGKIHLGDGSDPVARKSDLQAVVNFVNAHMHVETTPVGPALTTPPASSPGGTPDLLLVPSCSPKVVTA